MLRSASPYCFLITFLFISPCMIGQTEFSADVVQDQKTDASVSKIYFARDKMRFDAAGHDGKGGTMIFDLANNSYIFLMTAQHKYMEVPSDTMASRGMFSFFRSGNVENACEDWMKSISNQGGDCHKVGKEPVNGRSTVKYEGANSQGEKSTVWLDSKLRFPVKWKDKDNGGEMRNIQEGPQPASLFQIPEGYTKISMGAGKPAKK